MRFFKKCFLFLWIIEFLLIGTGHYMAVATRMRKKMSHPATQAATLPLQSPYLGLTSKHTFLAALSRSKSHVVTNQRSQNVTVMNNLKFPINPLCYPWDSCIGRCGQDFSHLTFYCYCDSMCLTYGDCCVDFLTRCETNETLEIFQRMSKRMNRRYPTCWVEDELSWPYLIVDACPTFSMNDSVKNMCEGVDKNVSVNLVLGDDGLLYANKKCADCNGVTIVVSEQDFNIQNNWYVTSNENYTNVHVLQNSNSKSPYFEGKKKQKLKRHCSPSISSCKYKGLQLQGYKLDWLCLVHSGTIVSRTSRQLKEAETLYKNVYCALCNGENLDMLSCLTWIIHDPGNFSSFNEPLNSISKHWLTELDNLHAGKIPSYRTRNKVQHDIPAAFSILLNFGLDGKERIIFSSEGEEEMRRNMARCKPGQMWDPFSNICRKLYCSTEFILVDFRCVHKNEIDDEKNSDVGGDVILADVDSKYVMLVLIIRMDYLDALDLVKNGKFDLNESVRTSLATVYNITTNRIQDIHITMQTIFIMPNDTQKEIEYKISTNKQIEEFLSYSIFANPVVLKVKFKLFEPYGNLTKSEPSVDSIVSSMSSSVAQNTFYLDIHNKTSKVFEIHENVEAMSDWCGIGSGGKQLEYWNQEFTLILNENFTAVDTWVRSVYINRTGRIYEKGEFVANILFQGHRDLGSSINVSGVVVVCERESLNISCPRMELKQKEFQILPNKTLVYYGNSTLKACLDLSQYEITYNGSILVCYDSEKLKFLLRKEHFYYLNFDRTEAYVSLVLTCISVVALTVVLLTYVVFPKLRNLPGCNTLNLTISLLIMQVSFLVGQRKEVTGTTCTLAGIMFHYEILVTFFWMNVMAFDLYQTFGHQKVLPFIRSKIKYLPRYMTYAYGLPMVIVAVAFAADRCNWEVIAPKYGADDTCWITNRYAALLFFATPLAVIMICNLYFYISTISSVLLVQKKIRIGLKHAHGKSDVILYTRMATVMGFTWIFGFVSAIIPDGGLLRKILVYLFLGFNCLQGLFIFFAFVCNRRVARLLRNLLLLIKHSHLVKCHNCHRVMCICEASVMTRNGSAETCVSIVSFSTALNDYDKKKPEIIN